ncbi:uncharacterized protein BT62DRAFT_926725 [Guyanagaster necrorhizus]|uniref:Uncharacterized protein n=1 Tax=Guyanagaster necrorhizus TaxID=856835 RepID=A0A9P7W0K5_9AGAR|nr:uncharacterized protein BT62DRAFT_926725 [Guyanagaster necrorhizus MCA 3950]KAG7451081.1 hypothetical protein BT62DRAFT_926725 [Guyanagaster necrorhizus MCA 3950]
MAVSVCRRFCGFTPSLSLVAKVSRIGGRKQGLSPGPPAVLLRRNLNICKVHYKFYTIY